MVSSAWISKALTGILIAFALAVFAHTTIIRPWYLRWGATDEELRMVLPGDQDIPPMSEVSTRAITIHAPADQIWPWLAQIGQERGGFYSYSWMENLFGADMANADHLFPQTEQLQVGDPVSYLRDGPSFTKAQVTLMDPGHVLSMKGWTFYLKPIDDQTTRLIVRYPFQVTTLGSKIYYYLNFEIQHFIMETGMMRGIKQRAEAGN